MPVKTLRIHPGGRQPISSNGRIESSNRRHGVSDLRGGRGDVSQGAAGHGQAYLVHDGKVEVRRPTLDGEQVLRTLTNGDLLGEVALFRGAPHSATALCRRAWRDPREALPEATETVRAVFAAKGFPVCVPRVRPRTLFRCTGRPWHWLAHRHLPGAVTPRLPAVERSDNVLPTQFSTRP